MKNVLIVDDEHDIGILLTAMLRSSGYRVQFASSYAKASELLQQAQFDTVFLDINLGAQSGFDLLPLLRNRQDSCEVIVISAQNTPWMKERVKEAGIKKFIAKPFRKVEILEAI